MIAEVQRVESMQADANILIIGIISHTKEAKLTSSTSIRDQSRVVALREKFKSVFTMSIDRVSTCDARYHLCHAMNRKGAKALINHLNVHYPNVKFDFICVEYIINFYSCIMSFKKAKSATF